MHNVPPCTAESCELSNRTSGDLTAFTVSRSAMSSVALIFDTGRKIQLVITRLKHAQQGNEYTAIFMARITFLHPNYYVIF